MNRLNRYFRPVAILAVELTAVLALSSCSALTKFLPGDHSSAQSGQPASSASGSSADAETSTIQGTLNQVDPELEYLILVSDGVYCRFDCSDSGADLTGLEPGDQVSVTYTGTLDPDSEDVTAQLVSIAKAP